METPTSVTHAALLPRCQQLEQIMRAVTSCHKNLKESDQILFRFRLLNGLLEPVQQPESEKNLINSFQILCVVTLGKPSILRIPPIVHVIDPFCHRRCPLPSRRRSQRRAPQFTLHCHSSFLFVHVDTSVNYVDLY